MRIVARRSAGITESEQQMRTDGVKALVTMALGNLPKPHTEDVIDDVFLAVFDKRIS